MKTRHVLITLAGVAAAVYLWRRAHPVDALTLAAQMQAKGMAVPPQLKQQVQQEHG